MTLIIATQETESGRTSSTPVQAKKFSRSISINKSGCHLSYKESINGRITVQVGLGINSRHYLKSNQSKKGWRYGSSGGSSGSTSARPFVQTPVLKKRNKEKETKRSKAVSELDRCYTMNYYLPHIPINKETGSFKRQVRTPCEDVR
jgi:hypothetical protein